MPMRDHGWNERSVEDMQVCYSVSVELAAAGESCLTGCWSDLVAAMVNRLQHPVEWPYLVLLSGLHRPLNYWCHSVRSS